MKRLKKIEGKKGLDKLFPNSGKAAADCLTPNLKRMPHPWQFHGWAAAHIGSGDFADVKLRFLDLID
jgi:hypothetical protein